MTLTKDEGSGLGFSIAGGMDLEQKSVTVNFFFFTFTVHISFTSILQKKTFCDVVLLYFPMMPSHFTAYGLSTSDAWVSRFKSVCFLWTGASSIFPRGRRPGRYHSPGGRCVVIKWEQSKWEKPW